MANATPNGDLRRRSRSTSARPARSTTTAHYIGPCPASFSWDFGDGSPVSTDAEPDAHLHHAGHLRRHADGDRQRGRHRRQVGDRQRRPTRTWPRRARATATPTIGRAPLEVTFELGRVQSTPTAPSSTYTWDFGDGSPIVITPTRHPHLRPRHLDGHADGHRRRRCQRHRPGRPSTAPSTRLPTAVASATPTSRRGAAGGAVQLGRHGRLRLRLPRSCPASLHWDFGDGTDQQLPEPEPHLRSRAIHATLTVTDNEGGIGSATVAVDSNIAPTAVASADVTAGDGPRCSCTFTGSTLERRRRHGRQLQLGLR